MHLTIGLFVIAIAFDVVGALYPLEKRVFRFLALPNPQNWTLTSSTVHLKGTDLGQRPSQIDRNDRLSRPPISRRGPTSPPEIDRPRLLHQANDRLPPHCWSERTRRYGRQLPLLGHSLRPAEVSGPRVATADHNGVYVLTSNAAVVDRLLDEEASVYQSLAGKLGHDVRLEVDSAYRYDQFDLVFVPGRSL